MAIGGALRSLPRRIRDSVRQEGSFRFVLRALVSPAYRANGVRAFPLTDALDQLDATTGERQYLEVHPAVEADVQALIALRPGQDAEKLAARLAAGQTCFVGFASGRVVTCRWAATGEMHITTLGLCLPLLPDEVLVYDVFVHPACRSRGTSTETRRVAKRHYLERGFRTELNFITLGRWPRGGHDASHVATIRVLRLGPFRKFWVKTYGPQAEYWRKRLGELRWA